jgi:uncharacterized protein
MTPTLSAVFGRSPIKPIQEHMAIAHHCVELLGEFLEASFIKDWDAATLVQQKIRDEENSADDLKSSVRTSLPKSIFLPVSRTDLLELLRTQDKLANRAKDIAGLMLGRRMEIPECLVEEIRDYYSESLLVSAQALKVINELDELLETGFRGKEVDLVEALINELDDLEHQTDVSQVKLRAKLFEQEDSMSPVHVIFLYKVIDQIGDLADISESVGARLLLLIAR